MSNTDSGFDSRTMKALGKMGIENPWELIMNLPDVYDDFTAPTKSISKLRGLNHNARFYAAMLLKDVKTSDQILAAKKKAGQPAIAPKMSYVKVDFSDGIRDISAMIFGGQGRVWLNYKKEFLGKVLMVSGKVTQKNGYTNLTDLIMVPDADQGRIVARYKGKEKVIRPERVAELTRIAMIHHMEDAVKEIEEAMGEDEQTILQSCHLPYASLKQMLFSLHLPESSSHLQQALSAAKDLNAYYGVRKALESTIRQPSPESAIELDIPLIKKLVEQHPFTPTPDQRKAIWDIVQDLSNETPMSRLLSADVGNGKTMAYGIPAAYAAHKGKNVVVLLPTEPLAAQVADDIREWYPELNVHLATSGFNAEVKQGEVLVGTTAVLSWLKKHPDWKVDFAITDEQQKMGTAQREALNSIGTHVLEATATPIPRTMAQTLFGIKKVSIIKDCPVEKKIKTHLIGNTSDEKRNAMRILNHWVKQGRRIAVIYPLVSEHKAFYYHADTQTLKEAEDLAAQMRKPGLTVQKTVSIEEAGEILTQLDDSASSGFLIQLHAEDTVHTRMQKRLSSYLGEEGAAKIRYLGSQVDDELEQRNRTTIINGAERWEKLYPGRVVSIHGRSKRSEKAEIIKYMNNGNADVLLSTTLIEIGANVKNLNALMVIDAENLGAFTLHQLRGRIARNGGTGDFIMMAGSPLEELDQTARDRMNLLVKHTNGDEIAMYDMEQRGFGNLGSGGKQQKGFEDGIFPSLKLTPAELDGFLRKISRKMQASANISSTP